MSEERGSGRLTVAVVDVLRGVPAEGMLIDLFRLPRAAGDRRHLRTVETAAGGVVATPLVEGEALVPGIYELFFHVGRYFKAERVTLKDAVFLDVIPVRFSIADGAKLHHLTLLASPVAYTVYRS